MRVLRGGQHGRSENCYFIWNERSRMFYVVHRSKTVKKEFSSQACHKTGALSKITRKACFYSVGDDFWVPAPLVGLCYVTRVTWLCWRYVSTCACVWCWCRYFCCLWKSSRIHRSLVTYVTLGPYSFILSNKQHRWCSEELSIMCSRW